MTGRLPFTLAPLDGEPFGLWLHAYAARLAMSPGHLAEALGIPARQGHGTGAAVPDGPSAAQLAAVCASAGLALPAVTAMLAAGPSLPPALMLAWAPHRATRFCPACLAEDPGQMPAAWSLPVTFFCLRHGRLLASRCPHCGGPHGCRGRLDTASSPRHDGIPAARQAQEAISGLLAGLRDPAGSAASRRHALSRLTDIILTAYHLAADRESRRTRQAFTPGMLDAGVLTTAFTLLTARPDPSGPDPLASLVTGIPPGTVSPAIPSSWRPASPALAARITPRPRPLAESCRPAPARHHAARSPHPGSTPAWHP